MPRALLVSAALAVAVFAVALLGRFPATAAPAVVAQATSSAEPAVVAPTPSPTPPPTPTPVPTPPPTPRPTPVPQGPIVALGDSITYGYGNGVTLDVYGPAPAHSYPWDMSRDLGIPVVNAGISGTTAEEVLDPASESAPRPVSLRLPALLALHPRLMIVGFGTNEAIRGWPIAQTVADYRRLLNRIAAAHVPILLVGTHVDCSVDACTTGPRPTTQPYTTAWDAALRGLAAEYHAGLVVNVEQGIPAADMTSWIHPNIAGYRIVAERIEVVVRRMLGLG